MSMTLRDRPLGVPRIPRWIGSAIAGLVLLAGAAAGAAPPDLPRFERDGAVWVVLDGQVGAALGLDLDVEWKPPWITLRLGGRTLRAAAGWRVAAVSGDAPALCWLPDPARVDAGRPVLTPSALGVALTALGAPHRWDRAAGRLTATEAIVPALPPATAPPSRAAAPDPPAAPPSRDRAPVIVVDAGHGGNDCGARGASGLCEKTVTLDIARRLAALLKERGTSVTMTRTDDRYLSLPDRVAITRRARADLFVSVHVNASPNRTAHGIETYVYGARAMGRSAEEAVRRENADANYMDIALGDLEQQAHHDASIRVAGAIESSLVRRMRTVGRGKNRVFAAPFYVLARSGRPAVLIEVGFISHRAEERKLRDTGYRRQLAESIAAGLDGAHGAAAWRPAFPRGAGTGG